MTGDGVLDRRLNAHAVEETLLHLQNLLLDTEQLKKRYGLKLVTSSRPLSVSQLSLSESQRVFTSISDETRRQIMTRAKVAQEQTIFKRLWWAAVNKEKIEKLVRDVYFLVRELWDLLDPWRHDDLVNSIKAIASDIITWNNRFDQLTSLNEALNTLRVTLPTLPDASLKTLAVSAEVKALRVGLGNDDQEQSQGRKFDAPKRQELLQRLERLSRLRLTNFKPMKKHDTIGLANYDGQRVFGGMETHRSSASEQDLAPSREPGRAPEHAQGQEVSVIVVQRDRRAKMARSHLSLIIPFHAARNSLGRF